MRGITQAFSLAHQVTSHVHEAVSGKNGRMIGANALSHVESARRKGKGVKSLKLKLGELLVLMGMESKPNNASHANVQVLNINFVSKLDFRNKIIENPQYLHVCLPGELEKFTDIVIEWINKIKNIQVVVIHSTVKPGTTKSIQERSSIPILFSLFPMYLNFSFFPVPNQRALIMNFVSNSMNI